MAKGGRVGMQDGGELGGELGGEPGGDRDLAASVWITEPEPVKQSFNYDFEKYYVSGVWMDKAKAEAPKQPLPPTPPVNPEAMKDPMVNTNLMQTGLTQTEQALLSNEEKSIRLRQRGLSR